MTIIEQLTNPRPPQDRAQSMRNAVHQYLIDSRWTREGPREVQRAWRSPDQQEAGMLRDIYDAFRLQMERDLAAEAPQSQGELIKRAAAGGYPD